MKIPQIFNLRSLLYGKDKVFGFTSMSVLLTVGPKCMLAASHAADLLLGSGSILT